MREMQWEIDERTVRDCPGARTESEWREAVKRFEEELRGKPRCCSKCGQSLVASMKYRITETEAWLPSKAKLPRGRWGLAADARTLKDARQLRAFMGPRATIWVRIRRHHEGRASTFKRYK